MKVTTKLTAIAAGIGLLAASGAYAGPSPEVWVTDQGHGAAGSGAAGAEGGLLYIYDSADLQADASAAVPDIINLAALAATHSDVLSAAGCDSVGRRPHMLLANETGKRMILSHTASDGVYIFDTNKRTIVGCVPVDAHFSIASPDGTIIIAGDIGEGILHKIGTNFNKDTYSLASTTNISSQTGVVDDNPICSEFTKDSKFLYTTMQKGGLVIHRTSDMSLVQRYDRATVEGVGCGLIRSKDKILTTGETGIGGVKPDSLYVFDASDAGSGTSPDPQATNLSAVLEDVHGAALCGKQDSVSMNTGRLDGSVVFTEVDGGAILASYPGAMRANPSTPEAQPDVADNAGRTVFLAMRGPKPTTAIGAAQSAARTPGVAVLHLDKDCMGFTYEAKDFAPMLANPNTVTLDAGPDAGMVVTGADAHGLDVVERK